MLKQIMLLLLIARVSISTIPTSCTAGQYLQPGTLKCVTCTAGYYCPNTSGVRIKCPRGNYQSATGQTACSQCTAGSYCPGGGSTSQSTTGSTYFSLAEYSAQYSCNSNGTITATCATNVLSTACDSTTQSGYKVSGASCAVCGIGYGCLYGSSTTCTTSYTTSSTESYCTSCPPGYSCASGVKTQCTSGNVWYNGNSCLSCDSAPAATYFGYGSYLDGNEHYFYCTGRSSLHANRGFFPGEYYTSASAKSLQAAGKYVTSSAFASCLSYYISATGFTSCILPNIVGYSISNAANTISDVVACAQGQYRDLATYLTTSCHSAAVGYFVPSPGLTSSIACVTGFYCPVNSQMPTKCPTRATCSTTAITHIATTNNGYYISLDQITRTTCEAGYYCLTTYPFKLRCTAGAYSNAGLTSCTTVNAGYYSVERVNTDVTIGYFTDLTKWWYRILCPGGYQCSDKISITKCDLGSYKPAGDTNSITTGCYSVSEGNYAPDPTASASITCPVGMYCAASSMYPSICDKGNYCDATGTKVTCAGSGASYFGTTAISGCVSSNHDRRGFRYVNSRLQFSAEPGYYWDSSFAENGCANFYMCNKHESYDCYNYYKNGGANWGEYRYYCKDQPDMTVTMSNRACYGKRFSQFGFVDCFDCLEGYDCSFQRNMFLYHADSQVTCSHEQYSRLGDLLCHKYKKLPLICDYRYYQLDSGSYTQGVELTVERDTSCNAYTNDLTSSQQSIFGFGTQTECLAGTYKEKGKDTCTHSHHEFIHLRNTAANTEYNVISANLCNYGSYCFEFVDVPTSSHVTISRHCPLGTYQSDNTQDAFDGCKLCPEGSYCPGNGIKLTCPATFYCKVGHITGKELYCPPGFLTIAGTGYQTFYDVCTQCAAGNTCTGSSSSSCYVGYICPLQTSDPYYYGSFPGTYQPTPSQTLRSAFLDCTSGSYCPSASSAISACPIGTYQSNSRAGLGAHGLINCKLCTLGMLCPTSSFTGPVSTTNDCPIGSYCPEGSSTGYSCPAGTYSITTKNTRLSLCLLCPVGYYCPEGTNAAPGAGLACPAGYYCPLGTAYANDYPCPGGFKLATTGGQSLSDCTTPCNAGYYCPQGSATGIVCPADHICPTGSSVPQPTSAGKKVATTSTEVTCVDGEVCKTADHAINPVSCSIGTFSGNSFTTCDTCTEGSKCAISGSLVVKTSCANGLWSAAGSFECVSCPVGYFCAGGVKTQCTAGKYCAAGSSAEAVCGTGKFCPSGLVTIQRPCPPGTIASTDSLAACTPTPAGYFTAQAASTAATPCAAGFYCEQGSRGSIHKPCPQGYSSIAFARETLAHCSDITKGVQQCAVGKYCPPATDTGLLASNFVCPIGFFCDISTYVPTKCPLGTYGAAVGLQSVGQCTDCLVGKACTQTGLTAPDFNCLPGYYCKGKSQTQSPTTDAVGGIECEPGGYCPGNTAPQACDVGQYNPFYGSRSNTECINCPAGYYCSIVAAEMNAPKAACPAGNYCPEKTASTTMLTVAAGYHSPTRQGAQIKCIRGNVTTSASQQYCSACSAGKYCSIDISSTETPCTTGHYCLAGTADPKVCPIGTYNTGNTAAQETDCTACDGGSYCPYNGMPAINVNEAAAAETHQCSAGYYCNQGTFSATPSFEQIVSRATYGPCPKGNYCPAGSTNPTKCPAGTYSNSVLNTNVNDCVPCDPGYYCDVAGLSLPTAKCTAGYICNVDTATSNPVKGSITATQTICLVGYYCEEGSSVMVPCPPGTYQNAQGQAACITCPQGYYCPQGSSSYLSNSCPVGHYCPDGTTFDKKSPCSPGTFNVNTGSISSAACASCTAGKYCLIYGLGAESGPCGAGFYCLLGAVFPNPPSGNAYGGMCTFGEYCAAGSSNKADCDAGKYCQYESASAVTNACDDGYKCIKNNFIPNPHTTDMAAIGRFCNAGSYCSGNTETQCGTGTYMPYKGAKSSSDCIDCPLGYACTTAGKSTILPTDMCTAGYYCVGGSSSLTQNDCLAGYYCPLNSFEKIPCAEGTYSSAIRASSCSACAAPNYCPYTDGVILSTAQIACPAGYYCSLANLFEPVPCDPGKYQSAAGQTSCLSCTNGKYCDRKALSNPSGDCADGYLCTSEVRELMPSSLICSRGFYCPNAVPRTSYVCPAGSYCLNYGQIAVSGTCYAGYICNAQSTVPNPTDNTIGYVCPTGRYCTAGLTTPAICGLGTYNDYVGSELNTDCKNCITGMHCASLGLSYPTSTFCPAGKTCLADVESPCPIGYKCPSGLLMPILCLPGTYSDALGASTCTKCDAGYYCRFDTILSPIRVTKVQCPQGYYCPEGTFNYELYPCPAGTMAASAGYSASTSCTLCTVNYYCLKKAQFTYTDVCDDGYLCPAGSTVPAQKGAAYECPSNYFCQGGIATQCSDITSTYPSTTANMNINDCLPCTPGKLCTVHATSTSSCPAGSYCVNNGTTACVVGKYCPIGSFATKSCIKGTYSDVSGLTVCKTCDSGYYCNQESQSVLVTCPANKVCIAGTYIPSLCTYGQYLSAINTCSPCPSGKWCWIDMANNIMGNCLDGYICHGGSSLPAPPTGGKVSSDADWGTYNGRAAAGYYTVAGDTALNPCSAGTYQSISGVKTCIQCPPGYYCPTASLVYYSAYKCTGGYLCLSGSSVPNPTDGTKGVLCPLGKYCPAGYPFAQTCLNGYVNSGTGKAACDACSVGSFCINGIMSPCKSGNTNCISATPFREPLCPLGTYNLGSSCASCIAGVYCVDERVNGVTCYLGTYIDRCKPYCLAGYICTAGSSTPTPSSGATGNLCDAGRYCLHGTTSMVQCSSGKVREAVGAIQATDCIQCKQGQVCYSGNPVPDSCPMGYYCPPGELIKCPIRTFNNITAKEIFSDCKSCASGLKCTTEAVANPSTYKCPKGNYCNLRERAGVKCPFGTYNVNDGSSYVSDCQECVYGYYCEEGCSSPVECPDGSVCEAGSKSGKTECPGGYYCQKGAIYPCPSNYYCSRGSKDKTPCTSYQYCPGLTEYPINCLDGEYAFINTVLGYTVCKSCPMGTYRETLDPITACKPCIMGYLCFGGTNTKYPIKKYRDGGVKCPAGYYCPEGALAATGCPPGTYNPFEGVTSMEGCALCPAGTYSRNYGQKACDICGNSAYSLIGASTCKCYGLNRIFLPTDSSCRCMPGYEFLEDGIKFTDENSRKDCTQVIYAVCDQTQVRTFDGKCVGKYDCNSTCGTSGGVRSSELGVCACNNTNKIDNICDWKCRKALPTTTIGINEFGTVSIYIKTSEGYTSNLTSKNLTGGATDTQALLDYVFCSVGSNCTVIPIEITSTGVAKGIYGLPSSLNKANSTSRIRSLAAADLSISNPVLCTYANTTITFDIPDTTHYPVYQKDSLLNTNNHFDYGAFKILASTLNAQKANGITKKSIFAFTFTEGGNYFFTDSANTDQTTIISVKKANERCPNDGTSIESKSVSSLSTFGVSVASDQSLTLAPDYKTTFMLAGILVLSILMFFLLFYILEKFAWNKSNQACIDYRSKQKKLDFDSFKFLLENGEGNGQSYVNIDDIDEFVEDELSLKDLEKLEKIDLSIMDSIQDQFNKFKNYFNNTLLTKIKEHGKKIKDIPDSLQKLIFLIEERYAPLLIYLNIDIDFAKLPNAKLKIDDNNKVMKNPHTINIVKLADDEQCEFIKAKKEALPDIIDFEKDVLDLTGVSSDPEEVKKLQHKQEKEELLNKMVYGNFTPFDTDKLQDYYENTMQNVENIINEQKIKSDIMMQRAIEQRRKKREQFLNVLNPKEQKAYIEETKTTEEEIEKIKKEAKTNIEDNKNSKLEELQERVAKDPEMNKPEILNKEIQKLEDDAKTELMIKYRLLDDVFSRQNKQRLLDKLGKESLNKLEVAEKEDRLRDLQLAEKSKAVDTTEIESRFREKEEALLAKQKQELSKINAIQTEAKNEINDEMNQAVENEISQGMEKNIADIRKKAQDELNSITEKRIKVKDRQLFLSSNGDQNEKNKIMKELEMFEDQIKLAKIKEQDELSNIMKEKECRRKMLIEKKAMNMKRKIFDEQVQQKVKAAKEREELHLQKRVGQITEQISKTKTSMTEDESRRAFDKLYNDASNVCEAELHGRMNIYLEENLNAIANRHANIRLVELQMIKDHYKLAYISLEQRKKLMDEQKYQELLKKVKLEEENDIREVEIRMSVQQEKEISTFRQHFEEINANELNELRAKLLKIRQDLLSKFYSTVFSNIHENLDKIKQEIESERMDRVKTIELDKKVFIDIQEYELKQRYNGYDEMVEKQGEIQKRLEQKKSSIHALLDQRRQKLEDIIKGKEEMTQATKEVLMSKYTKELEDLEGAIEAERNRQYLIMKERMNMKRLEQERRRVENQKMISYFVGAIDKNADIYQELPDTQSQDPIKQFLSKWKTDIVEQEKEEKVTTFEGLGKFLEHQKTSMLGMGGVYLEGDRFNKYRMLIERLTKTEEILEQLKSVKLMAALMDANKILKWFGSIDLGRKATAKRIGGGYMCFDEEGNIIKNLMQFIASKLSKKKPEEILKAMQLAEAKV